MSAVAVAFATYPGNVAHMLGEVKGPTLNSDLELLTAVEVAVTVGPTETTSRVGFAYGPRCARCHGLITAEHPAEPERSPYAVRTVHRQDCPA